MRLFHRDLGGTGRPPLVILHGMLGSSRNWQTAGRDLTDDAHVFALDLRNHGQSPHADAMDYDVMVADTLAWLDEQGLAKVTLLGHSMGGKTAMQLACRHPERVARLIVVDIAPKDYHWVGRRDEYDAMNTLDLTTIKTRADAEKHLEVTIHDWAMRKFITTNLERSAEGEWRWVINLPVLTAALGLLERTPLAPTDQYDGPTQFILGGKSPYVTSADHGTIQAHFPAARIELLPEAGHNPHMDAREPFIKLVGSFLADS